MMLQFAADSPPAILPTVGVWVRVGVVLLLTAVGVRLYRRRITLEAERAMLQNAWVVVSIYVAAVAADAMLPLGHMLSSVAGLVGGLVVSQGVLYVVSWREWLQTREHILYGWVLLGVGGLGVQPYVGGAVTSLWVILWLLSVVMVVHNGRRLNERSLSTPTT